MRVGLEVGKLSAALQGILAALGVRLPDDYQATVQSAQQPVEDLTLELRDPRILSEGGQRRFEAEARLIYGPADLAVRPVESRRFAFSAPFGPIEAGELRWYLESYHLWPIGVFHERAARVEAQLPQWGRALYDALLKTQTAQEVLHPWRRTVAGARAGPRRWRSWSASCISKRLKTPSSPRS